MSKEQTDPKQKPEINKKTNDDSDVHKDIIGENTEQTPLAKAVKGENDEDRQTPSEELR